MNKILVDRNDLEAILDFREGTTHYKNAESNLLAALEEQNSSNGYYIKIKWWLLTHKRHYENEAHVFEVHKDMNDIDIHYRVKEEFIKLYGHELLKTNGFRWSRDD